MTTATEQAIKAQTKYDSVFECPRCSGKGWLPEFRHISNGRCFLCGGAKKINSKTEFNYGKGRKPMVEFVKTHYYNGQVSEAITVWFDTNIGYSAEYCNYITDANREEMRALWVYFKANGASMSAKENKIQ